MKTIIYLSGILGGVFLVLRLIGVFADFSNNDFFLFSGLALLILVCIPLAAVERYREDKRIHQVIHSHKTESSKRAPIPIDKSKIKGWSMNNSPFRERKSGLKWGGGNIFAANASRGHRKSFLR